MKKTTRLASLVLALTATFATAGGEGWMTDFAAAKKKAAAEKKDLLVDFTGSDWCGWCIKLNKEVFQHDAFKKGVAEKFVLVELDYPRDKSGQSEEVQKQNAELQKVYSVRGFPTILMMDAQGRPFAKTGYQAGGPEKYVTHLDELQAKRVTRDEGLAAADKLEGIAKAEALVKVLKTLPEQHLSHYSDITDQVAKLDPEDKSGFVADQKFKQTLSEFKAKITGDMRTDIDSVPASVDAFISEHKLTGEHKQELLGIKMAPLMRSQKFEEAEKVLDAIIAEGADTRAGQFAKQFKPRLEQMKQKAAGESAPAEKAPADKE